MKVDVFNWKSVAKLKILLKYGSVMFELTDVGQVIIAPTTAIDQTMMERGLGQCVVLGILAGGCCVISINKCEPLSMYRLHLLQHKLPKAQIREIGLLINALYHPVGVKAYLEAQGKQDPDELVVNWYFRGDGQAVVLP